MLNISRADFFPEIIENPYVSWGEESRKFVFTPRWMAIYLIAKGMPKELLNNDWISFNIFWYTAMFGNLLKEFPHRLG